MTRIASSIALVITLAVLGSLVHDSRKDLRHVYACAKSYPFFPSLDRPIDFTIDLYGVKYVGNTSNFIDAHIYFLGAYEKPSLFFLRDFMKARYGGNSVFLDVGANTGQYSLFMATRARAVHAFDPYEPVLKRFREMISLNDLENVVVHAVGLGDEKQTLTFHRPTSGNLGTGSFADGWNSGPSGTEILQVVRGDDLLALEGVQGVGLIKMDIEGFERPALAGLKGTMDRDRPAVFVEVSPSSVTSFHSKAELEEAFPERYSFYEMDDGDVYSGRYHFSPFDFDFTPGRQIALLAIPEESKEAAGL